MGVFVAVRQLWFFIGQPCNFNLFGLQTNIRSYYMQQCYDPLASSLPFPFISAIKKRDRAVHLQSIESYKSGNAKKRRGLLLPFCIFVRTPSEQVNCPVEAVPGWAQVTLLVQSVSYCTCVASPWRYVDAATTNCGWREALTTILGIMWRSRKKV